MNTVKLRDVLQIASCRPRIRAKLDTLGLSFTELSGPGIPFDRLEGIDDYHVQKSLEMARQRLAEEEVNR